jgi:hypothetical protein
MIKRDHGKVDDDRRQRSLKARGVYLPRNLASIIAPVTLFYFLECIFIGLPMVNQRCILQAGYSDDAMNMERPVIKNCSEFATLLGTASDPHQTRVMVSGNLARKHKRRSGLFNKP